MPPFLTFLSENSFIPHGHCYLWKPDLVGLHIISDSLIALAYYSIPITLVYFVRKREDLPFNWIFLLFGSFIIACGTTHIMEVWTLWHPTYWLSGFIKAITATVSVYTAATLVPLVPQALALPSPAQMEAANLELKREIAHRAEVEESLRESDELFRKAFDYAPIGIALVAPDGNWLKVNHSLCNIVGYSESEMLATTFQRITYPDDLDANINYLHQLLRGEISSYEMEKRYFHKQGHLVWILLSVSLLRDRVGAPLYLIAQIQDITERKEAEIVLKNLNESLEIRVQERTVQLVKANQELRKWGEIFQHTGQGLIVASPVTKTLELMNPALAKMHGYAVKELTGRPIDTIIAPESLAETLEHIRRSYEKEQYTYEAQHIRKDKTVFSVLVDVANVKDESSNISYSIINVQDITKLKYAEAELLNALKKERELSELKSNFISMTSHEFRTPLATILSSSELLENYSHKLPEPEKQDLLRQISTAVQRMTQILNDVLAINKAEAGKIEVKPAPLDLLKFCHELVAEMQLISGEKYFISFVNIGDCSSVYMDEKILRHIFTNLLSNAIKYSPQGGCIEFEVVIADGEVNFKVKDSGIGIPLEDQKRLFQPFHRAKNVGNIGGTGLGLSIVKKMVELHEGRIEILSEDGVGTTFIVTIPMNYSPRLC
jgi:PAS domain S-box-containing protein